MGTGTFFCGKVIPCFERFVAAFSWITFNLARYCLHLILDCSLASMRITNVSKLTSKVSLWRKIAHRFFFSIDCFKLLFSSSWTSDTHCCCWLAPSLSLLESDRNSALSPLISSSIEAMGPDSSLFFSGVKNDNNLLIQAPSFPQDLDQHRYRSCS